MLYILCGHHKNPYDSSLISVLCLLMFFTCLVFFIFRMLICLLCLRYMCFFSVVLISSLTAFIKLHVCALSHFSRDWLFCGPVDCSLVGYRPERLLCPWDSPGKSAGVGCHALLQVDSPYFNSLMYYCVNFPCHTQMKGIMIVKMSNDVRRTSSIVYQCNFKTFCPRKRRRWLRKSCWSWMTL